MLRRPPISTLFPTRRSSDLDCHSLRAFCTCFHGPGGSDSPRDRKSTRLNSSHVAISYAVFCLKKKKKMGDERRTAQLRMGDAGGQRAHNVIDTRLQPARYGA